MARGVIDQKAANLWVAKIIPLVLIGIVAYASWVVIVLVCVNYLLKPAPGFHVPRPRTAIAILVVYSVLLLVFAGSYFRLIYTVATNPGYVPRGPQWHAEHRQQTKRGRSRTKKGEPKINTNLREKPGDTSRQDNIENGNRFLGGQEYTDRPPTSRPLTTETSAPDLKDFHSKDAFTCEGDGRPIWCSTCLNWKPDRTHHCREAGRCVRKMDHFCPWVGGVVSETSFKFFLQFVAWAAIYCIFVLVVMSVFIAELKREFEELNANWTATLALAGLFGLFSIGMAGSSTHFALVNSTTVENLSRLTKVWQLAIYIPHPQTNPPTLGTPTVTYSIASQPLPTKASFPTSTQPTPSTPSTSTRTYAILHSKPGENPWDVGPLRNFKSVMGDHWYDWILPLKYSPCCNHDRAESHFALGPIVDRMREEAGIIPPGTVANKDTTPQYRRRHPKREASSGHSREGRGWRRGEKRGRRPRDVEEGIDLRGTESEIR